MEYDVKLGVYDSFGGFLGYKVDTGWALSKKEFKPHQEENSMTDSHLFDNFLHVLNGSNADGNFPERAKKAGWNLDDKESLYVVTENLSGDVLSGVGLFIGKDDKYHITGRD